jgi:hypothetical protein
MLLVSSRYIPGNIHVIHWILDNLRICMQGKQNTSLEPGGQFELSGALLETLHQFSNWAQHCIYKYSVFTGCMNSGDFWLLSSTAAYLKNQIKVANDVSYKRTKYQFKIFCILSDIKMTSVDLSIVISILQKSSQLSFLCSSRYKTFWIEIFHGYGIHH